MFILNTEKTLFYLRAQSQTKGPAQSATPYTPLLLRLKFSPRSQGTKGEIYLWKRIIPNYPNPIHELSLIGHKSGLIRTERQPHLRVSRGQR